MTYGFAGTSAYAADCLARLLALDVEISLVLSQPDRPAGRSRRLTSPPVVDLARERGLAVIQPDRAAEAAPAIVAAGVGAMAICAYGQLLDQPLLDLLPWLNVHPSLLPRWRGAAPIERAILAGDRETGAAVMLVVRELDAGPLVHVDRFAISANDDARSVMTRSLELAVPVLASALPAAAAGALDVTPQTGEASYAAKLTPLDRQLDPAEPVVLADRRVRALAPEIGATITLGGERFVVWQATIAEPSRPDGPLVVPFADGRLSLDLLQPAGRNVMGAGELLRGWRRPLAPVSRGT